MLCWIARKERYGLTKKGIAVRRLELRSSLEDPSMSQAGCRLQDGESLTVYGT